MSFKARDVSAIASDAAISEEETKTLLEQMANSERSNIPATPASVTEMGIKIAQEKGRFDEFIKIMQK